MTITATPAADQSSGAEWIGDVFRRVAAQACTDYEGRNARVHSSTVVHAVRLETWVGDVQVPAPLCHVGFGGFAMSALHPSSAPVNCARCLHKLDRDPDDARGQGRLW